MSPIAPRNGIRSQGATVDSVAASIAATTGAPKIAPSVPAATMMPTILPRTLLGYMSATATRPSCPAPRPAPKGIAMASSSHDEPMPDGDSVRQIRRPRTANSRSRAPGRLPNRSMSRPTRRALTAAEVLKIASRMPAQRSRPVRSTIATTASVKKVALIASSAPCATTRRIVLRRTSSSLVRCVRHYYGNREHDLARAARRLPGAGARPPPSASG